jgi:hypothetical protein
MTGEGGDYVDGNLFPRCLPEFTTLGKSENQHLILVWDATAPSRLRFSARSKATEQLCTQEIGKDQRCGQPPPPLKTRRGYRAHLAKKYPEILRALEQRSSLTPEKPAQEDMSTQEKATAELDRQETLAYARWLVKHLKHKKP